jgi:hypothetical protein
MGQPCILCIVETGADLLSFSCGGHDILDNAACNMDRAVERRGWGVGISGRFIAEKKYTTGTGAGIGFG